MPKPNRVQTPDDVQAGTKSQRPTNEVEPIGSRVRRLRIERGMPQDRLALEAHVDQSGLSKFERGARVIGPTPLRRIAAVFKISYEELVAGSDFAG